VPAREDSLDFNADSSTVREPDCLLDLGLNGDQEALGHLLASYMPQLYRAALGVVGTPQEAEDALQDGLLRALHHLRDFAGRSRFSTWLTSIVINAALMRLRRNRREVMTSSLDQTLDRDNPPLANRIVDPGPNPEEMYAQAERLQILDRGLQRLPAAYRNAVQLRDVQGMSTKEAAEALGLPLGSLKSQLFRARLKLVEEVGEVRPAGRAHRNARSNGATTRHRATMELRDEVTEPAA
jgi:RNA polymerase sigma-70 factor, ECF subfamily